MVLPQDPSTDPNSLTPQGVMDSAVKTLKKQNMGKLG